MDNQHVPVTTLSDYKEHLEALFKKGSWLAASTNGCVFIRYADECGDLWTFSSSDTVWRDYCNIGLNLTVNELRCDENANRIDSVPSQQETNHTSSHEYLEEVYSANEIVSDNKNGKESVSNVSRKRPRNKSKSNSLRTLRSRTKKRDLVSENSYRDLIINNGKQRKTDGKSKSETNKADKIETETNKAGNSESSQEDVFRFVCDETVDSKKEKKKNKPNKSKTRKKLRKLKNKEVDHADKFGGEVLNERDNLVTSFDPTNENVVEENSSNSENALHIEMESQVQENWETKGTNNISNGDYKISESSKENDVGQFNCEKCSKKFATQVTLDLHLKSIICDRFKCQECGLLFATKDGIVEHKFEKHKTDLFQCDKCAKTFSSKAHLRCHNNVHIGRYMCPKCKKYFPEKRNMTQHRCKALKQGQGQFKTLKCEECKCTFSMKEEILVHNSLFHSNKIECIRCKITFSNKAPLMDHLQICKVKLLENATENDAKTRTNDVKKKEKKSLSSSQDLSIHKPTSPTAQHSPHKHQLQPMTYNQHDNPAMETFTPFITTHESNTSSSTHQLYGAAASQSALDVDNDKQCTWCKQLFSDSGELLKHVMVCEVLFSEEEALVKQAAVDQLTQAEAGEDSLADSVYDGSAHYEVSQQLFTCNDCGHSFPTKVNLYTHMKTHMDQEYDNSQEIVPFQCSTCEVSFPSEDQLNCHQSLHTQDLYQCNLCGSSFISKGLLRLHNNIHIKSYLCAICKAYFTDKSCYQSHNCPFSVEESLEINPMNCVSCEIGLSSELELEYHNSIHHCEVFRCKCQQQFQEQQQLMEHFKICAQANQKQENKCEICGLDFISERLLLSHENTHSGKFQCSKCNMLFSFEKALDRHENKCKKLEHSQKGKPIGCAICSYYFKSKYELTNHNDLYHNEVESVVQEELDLPAVLKPELANEIDYQCDLCGRNFSSKAYLKCHNNIHIGRYQCQNCKRCFSEARHLRTHFPRCGVNEDECDNYKPIYCDACEVYFPTDVDLNHHNRFFHNDEYYGDANFNCSHCDELLESKDKLMDHLKMCNYRTGKKTNLKELLGEDLHMKIINQKLRKNLSKGRKFNIATIEPSTTINKRDSSKVQCPTCFKYYTVSYIECHMRTHTNERPYKCPQCPKSFKFKNHILNHAITHIKDRSYICELCGKSFPHPLYLKFHKNMHTRPCRCDVCGKTFPTNPQVNRHKLTEHEGKKQHQCDLCGKCYSRSPALVKHKLARHKYV